MTEYAIFIITYIFASEINSVYKIYLNFKNFTIISGMARRSFMKAGSMENLIGASTNIKMADVPMRVYHEAERKGDTATMKRAMGYANELTEKAYNYSEKAQEELIKEQRQERKEREIKQEERCKERKLETEKEKEKVFDKGDVEEAAASVEISEEGRLEYEKQLHTDEEV